MITDAGRQMLPQEEVRVEGRRFSVSRQLGEGGFSFVYLVREIPDTRGEEFALKRVLLHEEEHARAVEREVAVMRQFNHPNLLPLYAAELDPQVSGVSGRSSQPRRANLIFPAYPEGTLLDRCVHKPEAEAFNPLQLLSLARQLCVALEAMHAARGGAIAHRDLKPGVREEVLWGGCRGGGRGGWGGRGHLVERVVKIKNKRQPTANTQNQILKMNLFFS